MNHLKNLARGLYPAALNLDGAGGTGGGEGGDGAPSFDPGKFQDEMKDFVVKAVNGAVSTHLTRALDNKLSSFGENISQSLLGQVKEMMGSQPQPSPQPGGSAGGNDEVIKNATAPLVKQIEELRRAAEANEVRAREEHQARMKQEESAALLGALTEAGVPTPLARAAAMTLHDRLERSSDGQIHFVSQESGPTGPYQERLAVNEGVARFLKTDEGKHFVPARPATGSGNRGGAAPGGGGEKTSDFGFVADMLGQLDM